MKANSKTATLGIPLGKSTAAGVKNRLTNENQPARNGLSRSASRWEPERYKINNNNSLSLSISLSFSLYARTRVRERGKLAFSVGFLPEWFLPGNLGQERSAGTVALLDRVCACPNFQKGVSMHDAGFTLGSRSGHSVEQHDSAVPDTLDPVRSVAPSAGVLSDGPNNPRAADALQQTATDSIGDRPSHMGRSVPKGASARSPRCMSSPPERQLELFPEVEAHGMADASESGWAWSRLRACEVVRLLNATPLGPVINDRQLYRHRQRAPWIQCDDRHIDLFKYTAWLALRRHNHSTARRRRVLGNDVLTIEELREILRRQDFRCALTGQKLTPTNFALDHIIPIAEGGDFTAANAQLVLKTVNRAKHTMSQADFIEMCRQVARHCSGESVA